jgi:protein SCO1/2
MVRLQSKLKSAGLQKDINIISHSVNPVHDTPEVLSNYAQSIGADLSNWNFVTGDTTDIYYQGKMGYMIPALPDSTAPGGFLHSDQFILVDKNRHIRGYYDGTSTAEVDQLFNDIQTLLNE